MEARAALLDFQCDVDRTPDRQYPWLKADLGTVDL
jgi:hypothetical protein